MKRSGLSLEEHAAACREAIRRGMAWLASQEAEVMKLRDMAGHYKAPYLCALTGNMPRARAYVDLFCRRYLQPDGDFRTTPRDKGWRHLPCSPANRYVYSNGWILVGLQKLGAYGAVQRGLGFLRRFQSEELGGFFSRFDLEAGTVATEFLDSSSTSSAALALLACGQITDACRAGEFLLRLIEAQPEPERYYFSTWRAGHGVWTDIWGDEDTVSVRGRKQFCLSAEADAAHEHVWLIGKPMKLLARLYDTTGETRYLDGARKLFAFFHRLHDNRWQNYSSCKIMWAGSELYRLTGDAEFADAALRILDWICQSQLSWGGWVHTLVYEHEEDQPLPAAIDLVQELCGEMSEVLYDISAQPT